MEELTPGPGAPGDLEDRILPWSQVRVISGLSRTTVWRLQKTGDFPASVQVSPNRVGWWQSEILEWRRSRLPRRLPEPPAGRRPRPVVADPPVVEPETPLLNYAKPPTRARRPRPRVPPGQGAFDF